MAGALRWALWLQPPEPGGGKAGWHMAAPLQAQAPERPGSQRLGPPEPSGDAGRSCALCAAHSGGAPACGLPAGWQRLGDGGCAGLGPAWVPALFKVEILSSFRIALKQPGCTVYLGLGCDRERVSDRAGAQQPSAVAGREAAHYRTFVTFTRMSERLLVFDWAISGPESARSESFSSSV